MAPAPTTEQGRATRERIVAGAAALIAAHGPAGTTLDDVRAATDSSKSQLYHYFGGKHGLVEAVIDFQAAQVLGAQRNALELVDGWSDLERWADGMVAAMERRGSRGGCPIGTLAAALADADEPSRVALNRAFEDWREAIGEALSRLRDSHLLAADADLEALTTTTLAAIQGGLLLTKTARDSSQLRIALNGAIAHLRASAPRTTSRARRQ